MAEEVRLTIEDGGYDLGDMLRKIDRLWLEGLLDATERDQLKEYARQRAVPSDSYATPEQRILALEIALRDLEDRVSALETSGGGEQTGEQDDEVPEWVQPHGAYDAYNTGDKVRYNDKVYESLIDGNVWSPVAYPQGWQEIAVV